MALIHVNRRSETELGDTEVDCFNQVLRTVSGLWELGGPIRGTASLWKNGCPGAGGCWVVSVSNYGENNLAVAVQSNRREWWWRLGGPEKIVRIRRDDSIGSRVRRCTAFWKGSLAAGIVVPFTDCFSYMISSSLSAWLQHFFPCFLFFFFLLLCTSFSFFLISGIYWEHAPHSIIYKTICKIKWYLIPRDTRPGTSQCETVNGISVLICLR